MYYADVKNCGASRGFSFIYIYIYIDYADNDRGGGCAQKGKGNSCIRI